MSFGQQSGPPASSRQIAFLLSLLQEQGYDFATGRHHYGFTQRQARGKFTVGEASEMIERLQNGEDPDSATTETPVEREVREKLDTNRAVVLRGVPADQLADELVRRGWVVIPPS